MSSPDETQRQPQESTFSQRLSSAVHEPLSALTKILLVLVLVLLLLSSVFIGLFAGAQHKLSRGREGGGGPDKPPSTATHTESYTLTESLTVTTSRTSTSISISTSTAISTTTTIATTTVLVPAPIPTTAPEEVCKVENYPYYSIEYFAGRRRVLLQVASSSPRQSYLLLMSMRIRVKTSTTLQVCCTLTFIMTYPIYRLL